MDVIPAASRGARSARADSRLCTSSGINLIVPLSFHRGNRFVMGSGKHDTLNMWCFNIEPASQTLGQHHNNIFNESSQDQGVLVTGKDGSVFDNHLFFFWHH